MSGRSVAIILTCLVSVQGALADDDVIVQRKALMISNSRMQDKAN